MMPASPPAAFIISTHTPLARRDGCGFHILHIVQISTHTPLARRDRVFEIRNMDAIEFLLTRLSQGVTCRASGCPWSLRISTHTPLARRDPPTVSFVGSICLFLLTRLSQGVTMGASLPTAPA